MPGTLAEALASWHEFYILLGTAAATLVGLLFVAATVGAGVFSPDRGAPVRVFLSATLLHFAGILIACLIVLVPVQSWASLGGMIGACGLFGLVYYGLTWRDMRADGLLANIDLEDRIWYALAPAFGYLCETITGAALAARVMLAIEALAATIGFLLIVGIHNAWDITVWVMTRRRQ